MTTILALLLMVNGVTPTQGDTRFDAVGRFNDYCTAVLVRPAVVLTARHCVVDGAEHVVRFRTGAEAKIESFYFAESADAALGYLANEIEGVEPVSMSFAGAAAGHGIVLVGTGSTAETETCGSVVTWAAPESYIQFPPAASAPCGTEDGDSGGAVIVGDRELRTLGVIAGPSDATNLASLSDDPRFNLPTMERKR